MTDTANPPADRPERTLRRRYPDGSDPDFEDDREDLETLFESLRRLTL
jgi:hypothetical protein